jgi:outer membrane lipoprotein SlyB
MYLSRISIVFFRSASNSSRNSSGAAVGSFVGAAAGTVAGQCLVERLSNVDVEAAADVAVRRDQEGSFEVVGSASVSASASFSNRVEDANNGGSSMSLALGGK